MEIKNFLLSIISESIIFVKELLSMSIGYQTWNQIYSFRPFSLYNKKKRFSLLGNFKQKYGAPVAARQPIVAGR